MCFKKIELGAQYMITIMNSTVNIIQGEEGLYDHFMSTRMFTMIMDKVFIWAPQMAMTMIYIC